MSELTDFKRGQIVGAQLGGMSVRNTAKLCDVSSRTVIKVMSVYNNYGHTPLVRKTPKVKNQSKKSTVEKSLGEGEGATGNPLLDAQVGPAAIKKVAQPEYLSKKDSYQWNITPFSKDDNDGEDEHVTVEKLQDGEKHNQIMLTDDDLKAALLVYGVKVGPIVGSTRAVYERKLMRLQAKRGTVSIAEEKVVSSEDRDDKSNEDNESGPEQGDVESDEQESSQAVVRSQNGYVCQQCFLPSSRLVSCSPIQDSKCSAEKFSITEMVEKMEKRMSPVADGKMNESDERERWTSPSRLDTSAADERQLQYFEPKESLSDLESKEPKKSDLPSNIQPTRTVFNTNSQRPTKGAAGRPVELKYPKPQASPATVKRREMEHRVLPVQVQIVVFVIIALLLFSLVESEPLSPLLALMNNFMQGFIDDDAVWQGT